MVPVFLCNAFQLCYNVDCFFTILNILLYSTTSKYMTPLPLCNIAVQPASSLPNGVLKLLMVFMFIELPISISSMLHQLLFLGPVYWISNLYTLSFMWPEKISTQTNWSSVLFFKPAYCQCRATRWAGQVLHNLMFLTTRQNLIWHRCIGNSTGENSFETITSVFSNFTQIYKLGQKMTSQH